MIAESILKQLSEFGYALKIGGGECAFVQIVPDAVMPKGWLAEFMRKKASHKEKLLDLCVCDRCERVTTELEDMDVLATNCALCDDSKCPYKGKR